jgi:toxin ParE1/3/4
MPSIVVRPKAVDDLAEIWAYIAEDSLREANAFASRIHKEFRMLSGQPRMGRERPELLADLRSFPVGRYVIFYPPHPHGIGRLYGETPLSWIGANARASPQPYLQYAGAKPSLVTSAR